jgi:hypothetical protein
MVRKCKSAFAFSPSSLISHPPEIPRLKYRAFDHDRSTPKEKKLLIEREGHSLPLRRQSLSEGPPPLDALFAFGSMAPQSLLGERPFWLNGVLIGIWGHRCTPIAGLGSAFALDGCLPKRENRAVAAGSWTTDSKRGDAKGRP